MQYFNLSIDDEGAITVDANINDIDLAKAFSAYAGRDAIFHNVLIDIFAATIQAQRAEISAKEDETPECKCEGCDGTCDCCETKEA